jgi:phytoene/squalene synthetase
LPGRAGWELRLVVQGGLRILEKIAAMDHATLSQRPALSRWDAPRLFWRALADTPGRKA